MALGGWLEPPTKHGTSSVRRITERVSAHQEGLTVDWAEGAAVPEGIEPLAQSVLLEALRNARKHAPDGDVAITIDSGDEAFVLEVVNDGVGASGMGAGLGLRMASLEALQHDAIVEFGPMPPDSWHVRLLVPHGPMGENGRRIRVLVVDDHDVVQWGFRLLLERPAMGRALPGRAGPATRRSS